MAAYAALVSLVNDLEFIPNHPTHSFSFDNKQITSLSQIVHFLIDFMDTYDSHGCTRESAQLLESRIASAALAAHDVIESQVVDQITARSTLGRKARCYFLLDLQKAIDNMDFVKRKAMRFKEKSGLKAEQPTYSARASSSEPLKNVMVGFDDAVVRLMEKLTGEPSSKRIIPIVGMGGMGKTTLAKNAYENLCIEHHFDVRRWATISQEYSVENILAQLLSGKGQSGTGRNVGELGLELHKMLCYRRYLIVLDDMWSLGAWDEIQMFFPDNGNGSRVIVTTRLSNMATHLSSSPFEMEFLDKDKSWELFCGKAFGEEDCPVELEEIGKKIVKRCGGLPLSIVVIGGHLRRSSRAIEYWEKVANSMNPISSSVEDEQCLNIISLSYDHLPAHLKPCFLYMGFKEDERIRASQLIRFWVGEGFIKAKKGLSMEDVAEDYLKDLVDRNLILAHERGWNGKIQYCGIHDTVRELCLKVIKKEKFRQKYMSSQLNLSALDISLESQPPTRLYFIPSAISLLWNMQMLIMRSCVGGVQIIAPYEIWELPRLRHLVIRGYLPDPVPGDREECIVLRNLHTLEVDNLRLTEEVCKTVPNIKLLYINYNNFYGDCEAISYYCPHNLGRFNKLESLWIEFDDDSKWRDVVLSFTFPTSLEELSLVNCHLDWKDLTMMIKSLHHLGSLLLNSIKGTEWNLVDEEFPCLKKLVIYNCDDLIYWNADSSHFPVLESLHIWRATKLSEIPFDFGEIPTLGRIELYYCSVSAAVSVRKIVGEQVSLGNDDLKGYAHFGKKIEDAVSYHRIVQEEVTDSVRTFIIVDLDSFLPLPWDSYTSTS